MKPKTMMLMMVAIGCGLAAAIMASKMMSKDSPRVQVLKAKKDIPRWTLLKDEAALKELFVLSDPIEFNQLPQDVQSNFVASFDELKPKLKDHITKERLIAGDSLVKNNIIHVREGGLASRLGKGFTGFAVKASADSAVGGWLQTDNYVKVLSTKKMPSGEKISKVLMQNVRIAAVDQASDKDQGNQAKVPTTITLEVTDDEAKVLKQAQDESPLTLALIPFINVEEMLAKQEEKEKAIEEQYKDKTDEKSKLERLKAKDLVMREQRLGETDETRPNKPKLTDLIRTGFSAFAVKTAAEASTGGLILPGNVVEVFGLMKGRDNKKRSLLLMKNVRVLAVDNITAGEKGVSELVGKTITLEVTKEEMKILHQFQDEAQITLGLMSNSGLAGKTNAELDADRKGEDLTLPAEPVVQKPIELRPTTLQIIGSRSQVFVTDQNGNLVPQAGGQAGSGAVQPAGGKTPPALVPSTPPPASDAVPE